MQESEQLASSLESREGPWTESVEELPEEFAHGFCAPRRRRHPECRMPEADSDLRDAGEEPVRGPAGPRWAVCPCGEPVEVTTESGADRGARLCGDPPRRRPDGRGHRVSPDHLLPELPKELREAVELAPLDRETLATEIPEGVPETSVLVDGRSPHAGARGRREGTERRPPPRLALPLLPGEEDRERRLVTPDRADEDSVEGDPLPPDPPPDGVRDDEEGGPLGERGSGKDAPEPAETPLESPVRRADRASSALRQRADRVSAREEAVDGGGEKTAELPLRSPLPVLEPEGAPAAWAEPAPATVALEPAAAAGAGRNTTLGRERKVRHTSHCLFSASESKKRWENPTELVEQAHF